MDKLKKPKNIQPKGLSIYCTKCKARVSNKCGDTGKRISSCNFSDKHKYKVMVYIPGTGGTKTKLLDTRDEVEAMQQAVEFKNELERNNYSTKVISSKTNIPQTIADAMVYYISYLNNEGPHEQEHKARTKAHVDEVIRYFKYFKEYLETVVDVNPAYLPIEKLDKDIVGKLKTYLLDKREYAPKTYNKYIQFMRVFVNFIIEEFDIRMKNPFRGFKRLRTQVNINTITQKEFSDLMKAISDEKETQIFVSRSNPSKLVKKVRYKSWLKDAILLALYTGRRREEIVKMKFDGIIENEAGEPISICISDFKVNRINGVSNKEAMKVIYVPIIGQLKNLLMELGYEEHKGKDLYILAPFEKMERRTMMDFMSKSFSYYYKKLKTGRDLTFYDLRKTYISHLYATHGSNARLISGHSGEEVMKAHYIDEKVLSEVAKNFTIFGL
ncbi:MAG: tyrosine-type recombinase/integrase [Bacteroidia bacterium]